MQIFSSPSASPYTSGGDFFKGVKTQWVQNVSLTHSILVLENKVHCQRAIQLKDPPNLGTICSSSEQESHVASRQSFVSEATTHFPSLDSVAEIATLHGITESRGWKRL